MAGILFVITGPSGTGKGTILERVLAEDPALRFSVSATTRQPRNGEQEGIHYFFVRREEFKDMIRKDEFLEWARVHGELYGTPYKYVKEWLNSGLDVVLDIDVQGGLQVKKKCPEGVFVFIAPPSMEELERRLLHRGTETRKVIDERLEVARTELAYVGEYQYLIVNDVLEEARKKLQAVILAERCRIERQPGVVTWEISQ